MEVFYIKMHFIYDYSAFSKSLKIFFFNNQWYRMSAGHDISIITEQQEINTLEWCVTVYLAIPKQDIC